MEIQDILMWKSYRIVSYSRFDVLLENMLGMVSEKPSGEKEIKAWYGSGDLLDLDLGDGEKQIHLKEEKTTILLVDGAMDRKIGFDENFVAAIMDEF